MMEKNASAINFTYTKLLKRLAPGALAVAACLLLLSLAGLTNQHEWAVGWLRRRYEEIDPLPFTLWMGLERGGVLIALSALAALMERIRRGAPPAEQEQKQEKEETDSSELPKTVQMLISGVSSLAAVHFLLVYAVQIAVLVLLKLLGAGAGTSAAVAVCAGAAFLCRKKNQKKGGYLWMRAVQGAVGSVYIGFAFAHWGMSSWRTALWTTAALYAASILMLAAVFTLITAGLQIREISKVALKHWKWAAGVAAATALWLWIGGSLEWTLEWTVGWLNGRYMERSAWSFCWRIAAERVALSVLLVIAISPFESKLEALLPDAKENKKKKKKESGSKPTPEEMDKAFKSALNHFFMMAAVAPVGETIALQALIILPLNALGADIGTQTAVSALLFALMHWRESPSKGIAAGLPGGVYFGFGFAFWHPQSLWTALWVTALSHALSNLLSVLASIPIIAFKARREMRKKKKSEENDDADETDETDDA